MKKIIKSKLFWGFILASLIGGGFVYSKFFYQKQDVEYITEKVIKGGIIQTVSATGKVKSASEIQLNFRNSGKLSVLNVKVGDQVKRGQILAQLRAADLLINVNRAKNDMEEAIVNLNKIKAGSTSHNVAVYEAAVDKAETDLKNAKIELENTESIYSQSIRNKTQNSILSINTALTKVNISIQKVYDTINYKGDRNNLITTNPNLENSIVNTQYNNVINKIDSAQLAYGIASINSTDENINNALDKTLAALSAASKILNDLSDLLKDVIITSVMTRSELEALRAEVNTERIANDSSLSTIQSVKNDLDEIRLTYKTKVDSANSAISSAQRNLEKSKADLDLIKAPARSEDIELYEARIRRAIIDLQLTQERYEETIIRSPIDGIITDVNYDIGEQTSISEPVIKMLADEIYEIEVNIPESDIVKLSIGDYADITFDAFTDNDVFSGAVVTINPAQTQIQDVVYYRVTVALNNEQSEELVELSSKIKPGMTANINIKTAEEKDVLIIPLRAVKDEYGKKIVQILENGQPVSKMVILGLRGDEGLIQVISGLEVGQDIITFIREKK